MDDTQPAGETWAHSILAGDRIALAKGITLLESSRERDQDIADALLTTLARQPVRNTQRVGITGVPGVGKSSFVEALGTHLLAQQPAAKIAVLTIDPSSQRTGGSILGDKTRMPTLATHARAFVRPSPSRGALGGVHDRTYDAIALCEAADFDIVFVETVGIGQSETDVADLVDCVVWLALPGAGDDLQGVKRGILEVADVAVVHKADGERLAMAQQAKLHLESSLSLFAGVVVPVLLASSLEARGIDEVWQNVLRQSQPTRRGKQRIRAFERLLDAHAREQLLRGHEQDYLNALVDCTSQPPSVVARRLVHR